MREDDKSPSPRPDEGRSLRNVDIGLKQSRLATLPALRKQGLQWEGRDEMSFAIGDDYRLHVQIPAGANDRNEFAPGLDSPWRASLGPENSDPSSSEIRRSPAPAFMKK
jgi:hypothetical protein